MPFTDLLNYYLAHNFALVITAIGFFIMYLNPTSRLKRHSALLMIDMVLVVLLSIATTIEYRFETLKVTYPILYVAVIAGYSLRPAIIYMLILTFRKPEVKTNLLLGLPVVINFVLSAFSPLNHWLFHYDASNNFVRNVPWGYIPHITCGFYLVLLAILMFRLFLEDDRSQAIAAVFLLVANTTATLLETFDVVEDILNQTTAASILFYFVFIYTYFKKRDVLTGLLDRHTFYIDYASYHHRVTALVCFDLNGLKTINDHQGHASGDIALKTLGRIFRANTDKSLKFYRLGGDEFEAIFLDKSEEVLKERLDKISQAVREAGYACSIGYAIREKDDSVDDLLHKADEAMYVCKRDYYSTHNRRDIA